MTQGINPLKWFTERIGKTVARTSPENMTYTHEIVNRMHAKGMNAWQDRGFTFRDPHPLTSSILTCNVISCDTCGKIGTTEDLDKEVAAKGFEGEGWKLLMDGTINCGCGE